MKEERESHSSQIGVRPRSSYRRLLIFSILAVTLVSVIPLMLVAWYKHHEYEKVLHSEQIRPMARLTADAKHSLDSFFSERLSALSLVIHEKTGDELKDPKTLRHVLSSLKESFGGFTDLGFIDSDGLQVSYAGPYNLQGKSYQEQEWFHEVCTGQVYVSDVFMGYRKFPHFVMAIRHEHSAQGSYVLRATIESEAINRLMLRYVPHASNDAFLITHDQILQTPSRYGGGIFDKIELPVMPYTEEAQILELTDEKGALKIIGYAFVSRTPFMVVLLNESGSVKASLASLRENLVIILLLSTLAIIAVVVGGSTYMVRRMRDGDIRRAAVFKKMEYTNRMAVIGRLAAGVAHEINNPLSIIGEKSGLLNDLYRFSKTPPSAEKVLQITRSILNSVERCSAITHRLLGFAKHMDVRRDSVDISALLDEVLGFLEKEAHYRNLDVKLDMEGNIPPIESDRGQLQQLFLNIINNAFAAVSDGGRIVIGAKMITDSQVEVRISDNGVGIPEENLQQIFEPFFTTKARAGTGLGLSITYGIVEKLGGQISVESKIGEGTTFIVSLPVLGK